jgi:hypothetical protein
LALEFAIAFFAIPSIFSSGAARCTGGAKRFEGDPAVPAAEALASELVR